MSVIISPNLVIGGSIGDTPPFPLTHARIGYESICTPDNVIASSEAAGFVAADAVNQFTTEYWQPVTLPATWTCDAGTGVDTDYIGIAGHTLGTYGNTVAIEYSTDGDNWTELFTFVPDSNKPIMLIYETTTARYWRLTVSGGSGIPRIGVIYIGQALQMQQPIYGGHRPIVMSRRTDIYGQMSDAGQYMARTIIRKGVGTDYFWEHLTAQWVREYFDPFIKAARTRAFFIAWRPATFPADVAYCWTSNDITPENMGIRDMMSVSMSVEGWSDD